MIKRIMLGIFAISLIAAAPMAWAADGDNIFAYSYGPAPDDPRCNNNIRGACAGSDLDGDGFYEIIVTDYDNGGQVHVYEVTDNNTLTYVWSSAPSTGATCRCVRTADMDNDGLGEIIFDISGGTWGATYKGGIHVYEWDGVTDNGYGAAYTSFYQPHPETNSNFTYFEGFATGDVDSDGENELVTPVNKSGSVNDWLQIVSVDGNFPGTHSWVVEHEEFRGGPHPFGGTPVSGRMGDMDGDGYNEAIYCVYDSCVVYIVEATGPDTYAYQTAIKLDYSYDGYFLDDFGVADLNGDGADEVYGSIYNHGKVVCLTGGSDVSTITYANNCFTIATIPGAIYGFAIGDQDHGAGSDGKDLYIATWNTTGDVYDLELTGVDPTQPSDWTQYTLVTDVSGNGVPFGIAIPPVDMDGDGRREVVVTYGSAVPLTNNWFRVFEWAGEPTAVTLSSFEAIGAQEQVELTWRVESEVNNAGYKIYRDSDEIAFVQSRGNSDSPLTYTWIDKDVSAGVTYTYRISDVSLDGIETRHDLVATATPKPAASAEVPTDYVLYQNYPNPFNADTHIRFTLAQPGQTTLRIYNTTGQLVATLVNEHLDAKTHEVRWDGCNDNGELIASGIYFYRLTSGNFAETKKMSFLR